MHDGTDNCGFFITHGNHSIAVATDLGCVSERADFYMRQANYLMIEANYDKAMLAAGPYPEYLKARILSDNGPPRQRGYSTLSRRNLQPLAPATYSCAI